MIEKLPALNAMLNTTSTLLILTGFYFIKNGQKNSHRYAMIGALTTSALFLVSYLVYHFNKVGITTFKGAGLARNIYLTILVSHSILALVIVPMIFIAVRNALKSDFAKHKKIVKWTFPLWLYVSFTGVIIYILLYQVY